MMCLNIGIPKNHYFPFGTNGKVVVLGVPILKHFRVIYNFIVSALRWNRTKPKFSVFVKKKNNDQEVQHFLNHGMIFFWA